MENRIMVKQFIDMDELSKQWESDNKLIKPICELEHSYEKSVHTNIVEYIKSVKKLYGTYEQEQESAMVLKKSK